MRPTQELTEQLFAQCPERVVERFYDHVVPADAVLPFILPTGPTGARLCFSYAQRTSPAMVWYICTCIYIYIYIDMDTC